MSRTKLIQAIASIAPSRVSPATELRLHLPVCLAFTGLSRDLVVEHLPKCSSNNLFIYERLHVGTGQNHKQHVRQRRCSIANTCGSGDLLHLVSDPPPFYVRQQLWILYQSVFLVYQVKRSTVLSGTVQNGSKSIFVCWTALPFDRCASRKICCLPTLSNSEREG